MKSKFLITKCFFTLLVGYCVFLLTTVVTGVHVCDHSLTVVPSVNQSTGFMYDDCYCDNCNLNVDGHTIVMSKACDWSDWLNWDCSCCNNKFGRPFAVRKRAICCENNTTLEQCMANCGYPEHNDTEYMYTCSSDICGKSTPITGACEETSTENPLLPDTETTTSSMATSVTTIYPSKTTPVSRPTLSPPDAHSITSDSATISATLSILINTASTVSAMSLSPSPTIPASFTSTKISEFTSGTSSSISGLSTSFIHTTTPLSHTIYSGGPLTDKGSSVPTGRPLTTGPTTNETSEAENGVNHADTHGKIGVILGAVFGSLAGLVAIGMVVLFMLKRVKQKQNVVADHPDNDHLDNDHQHVDNDCMVNSEDI